MTSRYRLIYKMAELPESVKHELKGMNFSDAGGPFNSGCVVSSVPSHRLIFAALETSPQSASLGGDNETCLVHFESGGFLHTYNARLYKLLHGKAELVASSVVPGPVSEPEELTKFLA